MHDRGRSPAVHLLAALFLALLAALGVACGRHAASPSVPSRSADGAAAPERSAIASDPDLEQHAYDAWTHPDEEGRLAEGLAAAQRLWSRRTQSRGDDWWQTVDARLLVDDLRRFSSLSREDRQDLAAAWQRVMTLSTPPRAADRRALEDIRDTFGRVIGREHSTYASARRMLAVLDTSEGAFDAAVATLVDARATLSRVVGMKSPWYATLTHDLGVAYYGMGRFEDAESMFTEALEVREDAFGQSDPLVAEVLQSLGLVLGALGRIDEAVGQYRRACRVLQDARLDLDAGRCFVALSGALSSHNEHVAARLALADAESLRSGETIDRGRLKLAQADLAIQEDNYAEGASLAREALALFGAIPDRQHNLEAARALEALGAASRASARFGEALRYLRDALEIRRRVQTEHHVDFALCLGKLAGVTAAMGHSDEAEPIYQQVVALLKEHRLERHPEFAVAANGLGQLARRRHDYQQAQVWFTAAKEILARDHPMYAIVVHNLGYVSFMKDPPQYQDAERYYDEADELTRTWTNQRTAFHATLYDNQARLYAATSRYEEAERRFRLAAAIRTALFDRDHPATANTVAGLAGVLAATGRDAEAADMFLAAAHADYVHVTRNFPLFSPQQKAAFLVETEFSQNDQLLNLVFARGQSAELGFQVTLLRKQILFESVRQESAAMRDVIEQADAEWRTLFQERNQLVTAYASAGLAETTSPVSPVAFRARIEELDRQLRDRNRSYEAAARLDVVTPEQVRRALRPGAFLVEYVKYHERDVTRRHADAWRYGALVVSADGVTAIDLKSAEEIEPRIGTFRAQINKQIDTLEINTPIDLELRKQTEYLRARYERDLAKSAYQIAKDVWEPLHTRLEGARRVYIASDGALSLVPFETLMQSDPEAGPWKYLVEDLEIVYLNTGRELARLAATPSGPQIRRAVLVGSPAYGAAQAEVARVVGRPVEALVTRPNAAPASQPRAASSGCKAVERDWPDVSKKLLEATAAVLKEHNWAVTSMVGLEAAEELVARITRPTLLQFFTHGQFLECEPHSSDVWQNPLLQTVLMLAGVSTWRAPSSLPTGEGIETAADGVLTAYEVTGMDLTGTELVNLVACETGLIDPTPDAIAGLRQAFIMAGARSVTLSMWRIPETQSIDQMMDFYENLTSDDSSRPSRYRAFHEAQIAALKRARDGALSGHPYYWGGPIFFGDPGDLSSP